MSKTFNIKRVETVNYWLDWDREEVIENMAFVLGEGDDTAEKALVAKLSELTDQELLKRLTDELDEYAEMFDYVIEVSEKYGDVQSQDLSVTLGESD